MNANYIICLSRCHKNGTHIRNVSFAKKKNAFLVMATVAASDQEIIDAVRGKSISLGLPCDNVTYKIEESLLTDFPPVLKHRTHLPYTKEALKTQVLNIQMSINCPFCNYPFPSLYKAIGHAKSYHPGIPSLPVYLYREGYNNLLKSDLSQHDMNVVISLLSETEVKIENIERKREIKRLKENERQEAREKRYAYIPNTWESISNFSKLPWDLEKNKVSIIAAGRVDTKRNKH